MGIDRLRFDETAVLVFRIVLWTAVAGLIGWYALQRYLSMLLLALRLSERSTCARCGTYGRYRLIGATARSMTVSCRNCEREWTIE